MSQANFNDFDRRMNRIHKSHQKLSRGARTVVTRDGLIMAKPRRRVLSLFPMRALLFVLIAGYAMKVGFFMYMGAETYSSTVTGLTAGTPFDQAAAYVLHADALTIWIADAIRSAAA